jgi:hypothetical protein
MIYKLAAGYCSTMFVYGFARQMRCTMRPEDSLYSDRIFYSTVNGLYYGSSLFLPFPLIRIADRIQIRYQGLDQTLYSSSYREIRGENRNLIL